MLFQLVSVLAVLFMFTGNLYAQELVVDDSKALTAQQRTTTDFIGIGTEGYGSPIQSDSIMSGEIVSSRSGNFHPYLSLGTYHTDNLFNTSDNEKSDTVAVISPGFWVAAPGSRQKLLDINTTNAAPGGLALSRFRTELGRRFQSYALYRADIREHDEYTEENRVDHRGEGYLGLSLRGGLSVELIDIFEVKADPYGTGGTAQRQLDKYESNFINVALAYDISPKLTISGDFGHYYVDYDSTRNVYRNRQDDSFSASLFYRYSPKTSFFIQAEYVSVDYDEDIKSDSNELRYSAGLLLKTSAKTLSSLRAGYSQKKFDQAGNDEQDDWLAEAQIDYFFTPKTSFYLRALRRNLESDIETARNVVSYSTQLGYRQRFTSKFRGEASILFSRNDYEGEVTIGSQTGVRDDDYTGFVLALGYTPIRWLNLSVGYEYRDRDSNFNTEDYKSNMAFIRVTAAL